MGLGNWGWIHIFLIWSFFISIYTKNHRFGPWVYVEKPKMLLPKCVKKLLPLKFEVYFQCPTSHWLLNRGLCVSPLNNRSIIQPCARLRCAGAAAQHGPAAPVGRDCGAPWGIHGGHGSPLGWILSSLVPRAMGPPIGDITWLVGGLVAILYFPRNNYWVANHPNWLSYFQRGSKHQPDDVGWFKIFSICWIFLTLNITTRSLFVFPIDWWWTVVESCEHPGALEHQFYCSIQSGISSYQLTVTHMFQRGGESTNQ